MNKNTVDYLNLVYDIDQKRGQCDEGCYKFTLEEAEKAIELVKEQHGNLSPKFHVDHYHLVKSYE